MSWFQFNPQTPRFVPRLMTRPGFERFGRIAEELMALRARDTSELAEQLARFRVTSRRLPARLVLVNRGIYDALWDEFLRAPEFEPMRVWVDEHLYRSGKELPLLLRIVGLIFSSGLLFSGYPLLTAAGVAALVLYGVFWPGPNPLRRV